MKVPCNEAIDAQIDLTQLGIALTAKPIVFGGMAMEFYGLRPHGHDIDLFVTFEDYAALAAKYPESRKDIWGDLGVVVEPFEIWRSIWKLGYEFFLEGAIEFDRYFVLSPEKLLLSKVLAMDTSDKQRKDLEQVTTYIREQNAIPEVVDYMNARVEIYLKAPDGTVFGGKY